MMSEIIFGFKFGFGAVAAVWLAINIIDFLEKTWRELLSLWKRARRK